MTVKDTLSFDGNQIYFETSGQGTPLVLIHGGGVDRGMWKKQVEFFSRKYRVITYDLRGHGQSGYSSNKFPDSKDLEVLMDSLHLPQIHLAGLSLGAIIAVDFVLAHPEKVDRLILLSPGLVGVQEKEESYLNAINSIGQALQVNDLEGAVEAVLNMTFNPPEAADPEIVNYVRVASKRHFSKDSFARIPKLTETAPLARLNSIQQPTLLISGSRDLDYMKSNIKALEQAIPLTTLVEISSGGHLVNWEVHKQVNKAIDDFLQNRAGHD